MEFSDLLDGVAPEAVATTEPNLSLAELVMFPVPRVADRRPEPAPQEAEEQADADALTGDEDTAEVISAAEVIIDEVVVEPPTVSRFEQAGIDDDMLPVRAARRRRLHR